MRAAGAPGRAEQVAGGSRCILRLERSSAPGGGKSRRRPAGRPSTGVAHAGCCAGSPWNAAGSARARTTRRLRLSTAQEIGGAAPE